MIDWWQRLFHSTAGANGVRSGEGVEVTYVHSWPWPPWITVVFLLLVAVAVACVYLREPGKPGWGRRLGMAVMRWTLIALVTLMLYGWMRDRYQTDLPDLVVVIDDSASMAVEDHYGAPAQRRAMKARMTAFPDQSASRIRVAASLLSPNGAEWLEKLARRYRLKVFMLGRTVRLAAGHRAGDEEQWLRTLSAEEPVSRLGDGLQEILQHQRGRPTAAIVLLTDGIVTEGKSIHEVAHEARRKHVPLFLVGIGDERPPRDIQLSDLLVDDVVFLGDVVHFDFKLTGTGFDSQPVRLVLRNRATGEILDERIETVDGSGQIESQRLAYRPQAEGTFELEVGAEPLEEESNVDNNRLSRVVTVRDEVIRVLYVQEYPNLEYRYLKTLLERALKRSGGKALDLTTLLQEADPDFVDLDETAQRVFPVSRDALFQYDVVIFGDVNPAQLSRPVLDNLSAFVKDRGGGVLFVAGTRHTPLAYRDTVLEDLFPFDLATASLPDPQSLLDDSFHVELTTLGQASPPLQLNDEEEVNARLWNGLPQLRWLLKIEDVRPAARCWVQQATTDRSTPRPVVLSQFVGAGKVIFQATDESYLWARADGDDQYFEKYWLQMIRYLSRSKLLGGNRTVELVADRMEYYRGEAVPLRVRFLDERMAPAEDDEVVVLVERQGGRRRRITLQRDRTRRGVFIGAASNLPDGTFRAWILRPSLDGQPPSRVFQVVPPPGENARLAMDALELKQAASTSQGHFYTIVDARDMLNDLPPGRQVRIGKLPSEPIWNSNVLIGLVVLLLIGEWLGRKRFGWT